jgi:hypothetical protein
LLLQIFGDFVDAAIKLDHWSDQISLTARICLLYIQNEFLWPDQT